MKKLFTSLLFLMVGATMNTVLAENYDLKIAGIQVTDDNKNNIKGSGISGSGSIKYNPSGKILTVENVTITTTGTTDGIYNMGIEDLAICFVGNVTINTNSSGANVAGIYCSKSTRFTTFNGEHTPSVNVTNSGAGPAIRSYNGSTIKFFNVKLTAKASDYHAIYASPAAELQINVSTLSASASNTSYAAFKGFTKGYSYTYSGCPLEVIGTLGYTFDNSTGGFVSNGTLVSNVTLYPPVMIGDEPLHYGTPKLTTTTTGATSISGSASFNCSGTSPKLTLTDFSLAGANIRVRLPELTVSVNGSCSVTNANDAMDIYANTKITGTGTLKLTSTSYAAISTYNSCNVELGVNLLEAKGKTYGFFGQKSGTLWFTKPQNTNIYYKFAGEQYNVLAGKLKFTGTDIYTTNTYWNPSDCYLYRSGAPAKSTTIESGSWITNNDQISYYNLYVGGTHVRQNCTDYITSPYITSGTARYNPSSKILTLNNVTIQGQGNDADVSNYGIYSVIDGLKISSTGTNNITTKNIGLKTTSNTTITGNHLNITSQENAAISIESGADLTLELESSTPSCFKGKTYGIAGVGNYSELYINKGTSGGAFYKFSGEQGDINKIGALHLGTGVKIYNSYTWYNDEKLAIYKKDAIAKSSNVDNGTWIRGDITWKEYPAYICGEQLYGYGEEGGNITGFYNKYTKYNSNSNITYHPSPRVLLLENVTIDYTDTENTNIGIIQTNSIDLTIQVEGTCALNAKTAYAAIWARKLVCSIAGSGTLNLTSKFCDIYPMEGNGFFIHGEVTVNATDKGIWSNNGENKLFVEGTSLLRAKKIYNIDYLGLGYDYAITEPKGAVFSDRAVRLNGAIAQDIVIKELPYGDLNGDEKVDIADAVTVLNYMANDIHISRADFNQDRKIDIADFVTVLNIMAGN